MHFFEKIDRSIDKQIYKQSNIVIDTNFIVINYHYQNARHLQRIPQGL